ncbi:MAG: SPFH domain-containing protein [Candidatus Latescibacteria bacterium]|nr:SPFH domain-containing protein [Candidatus Latescibacterota bacterium]
MESIREYPGWKVSGYAVVPLFLAVLVGAGWLVVDMVSRQNPVLLWRVLSAGVVLYGLGAGFFVVQPNEAKVLVRLGRYAGSVRQDGFWWTNPLCTRRHVSLRIHNLNSQHLKVNDLSGNPIEIAAVVVWRVVDSAKALFDVEHYVEFINIQCETAIRALASQFAYDAHDENKSSLRGSPNEVSETLKAQVQARLEIAGVEVSEARLSHLAYAPEIAQVMLRRQAAEAIVAARQKIVEGAVGMVESALNMLSKQNIVTLDEDKKAAMTNNLLVALVSEHEATPVINTGTLYT